MHGCCLALWWSPAKAERLYIFYRNYYDMHDAVGGDIIHMTLKERILVFLNKSLLRKFFWALVAVPHRLVTEQDDMIYRTGDLIRTGTLELISREIHEKNIGGAVAQLGVY